MLQNKAKFMEAHLGCINQVEDVTASTCLRHLWFTVTLGQDCSLEQPGGTRVVQNVPGSDTWWVKTSRLPNYAALALGIEHSNANTT